MRALQRIAEELPHLDWMPRVVRAAEEALLRKSWRPLSADELFAATAHAGSQLVRSAGELQDVVLDSLAVLQERLQGETPAAYDMWNEVEQGAFRPKDENHFADYIKRHLEVDLKGRGIVSLREVEIRRGKGPGVGERTDVHVTGMVPGPARDELHAVRVVIEVKGSWHRELDSAMEAQLVKRYLREEGCRHGIYLAGWYRCAKWDPADRRYRESQDETIDVLKDRLDVQASALSVDELAVKAFVLDVSLP